MQKEILDRIFYQYQTAWALRYGENFCPGIPGFDSNFWWHSIVKPRYVNTVNAIPAHANRVLEAGVGSGIIHNYLLANPDYENVTGIDIEISPHYVNLSADEDIQYMDVTNLNFKNKSFDLVLCLHVLEHLETEDFLIALENLRNTCGGTLVVGLPLNEPTEILQHTEHLQQFDLTRINQLFPTASVVYYDYPNNLGGYVIIKELHDNS